MVTLCVDNLMSTWESKETQSHQLLLLPEWKAGQQNHRVSLALKSEPYTTQHYQILNFGMWDMEVLKCIMFHTWLPACKEGCSTCCQIMLKPCPIITAGKTLLFAQYYPRPGAQLHPRTRHKGLLSWLVARGGFSLVWRQATQRM